MSSFARSIQRNAKRISKYKQSTTRLSSVPGRRLGVKNPKDKALLARLKREKRREVVKP